MTTIGDWVTQRQGATVLHEGGIGRRQAHAVLAAGLAGPSLRVGSSCLYERSAVEGLRDRPTLSLEDIDRICPRGVLIGRRAVDVAADPSAQVAAVSAGWQMSPWTAVWIRGRLQLHGRFPFLVTVAGFVALGADITSFAHRADGLELQLTDPGAWFDRVRDHQLRAGAGRAWVLRGLMQPAPAPIDGRTP